MPQQRELRLGFYAFGDHLQAQLVRHHDDGLGDGPAVFVGGDLGHEGLVYLQVIDVELFQVGHRRIAGAEVVDRHLYAGVAVFQQLVGHAGRCMQQHAFGDLDRNAAAGQAQPLQVLQPVGVVVVGQELDRRLVDADLETLAQLLAPLARAGSGIFEYPGADLVDLAGFLGQRDEEGRLHQPQARMVPAQQRLGLDQLAAGKVQHRLVKDFELPGRQCAAQLARQPQPQVGLFIHPVGEIAELVLAGVLGRIHRLVGLADQLFRRGRVVRVQGHAYTARHIGDFLADRERAFQRLQDLLAHMFDPCRRLGRTQDDGEFIAAQARHRVRLAHAALDAVRALGQQQVASIVAEQVVDLLEAVQVDEQQRHLQAAARGLAYFLIEPVAEQATVGQTGQRVEIGMVPDPLVRHLLG